MSSWPFDICPDDIEYIDLRPIGLCAGHVAQLVLSGNKYHSKTQVQRQ